MESLRNVQMCGCTYVWPGCACMHEIGRLRLTPVHTDLCSAAHVFIDTLFGFEMPKTVLTPLGCLLLMDVL